MDFKVVILVINVRGYCVLRAPWGRGFCFLALKEKQGYFLNSKSGKFYPIEANHFSKRFSKMKQIMRRSLLLGALVAMAFSFALPQAVQAKASLDAPLNQVTLPSKAWTFKTPDKAHQRILHPIKIGQAVNIRVHTYDVPVSAKSFLDQVRVKIIQKPDYKGAEVQLIKPYSVGGKSWDVFNIRRKDEINQQIWGIKTAPNVVLMVIYTGAGDYFNEYHKDLMKLIKHLS